MTDPQVPAPREGLLVTHFLTVRDIPRARDFYSRVLGGEVVRESGPAMVRLSNSWIILNTGGGPTEDKPDVVLEAPTDPTRVSSFLNLRVADIEATRRQWSERGAEFLTEPVVWDHEIRCYLRDPDGYLIEVGQARD